MNGAEIINKSIWRGYVRYDFIYKGRKGIFVEPKKRREGSPWVWRAEFFDAFDYADMALVKNGYCRAYYSAGDKFGSPEAVEWMKNFHDFAVDKFSLAQKAAIFGFSRGGLYSVNYAAKYPEDTACLYLDAPVLDLKSWPLGKWNSSGSETDIELCKKEYKTDNIEEITDIPLNKLDKIKSVPVLIVYGEDDDIVPPAENAEIMIKNFKGTLRYIGKKNNNHHPHSLENPEKIVGFIEKYYVVTI